MRCLIVLIGMAALVASVEAATLNKCIDAQGKVTYSNLPCHNAREVRTVDIEPAPRPDAQRSAQPAKPPIAKPAAGSNAPATLQLETRRATGKPAAHASASARKCDAITDKLGRVFDKMDQARHQGYTQKQMDKWDQEIKDLERKKQQFGCF